MLFKNNTGKAIFKKEISKAPSSLLSSKPSLNHILDCQNQRNFSDRGEIASDFQIH